MGSLTEKTGDLFDNRVIAHGCNCQGVMGSGVALRIKTDYPDAFEKYMDVYDKLPYQAAQSQLLGLNVYAPQMDGGVIVNMLTQLHFGSAGHKYVSYDAIEECFREVAVALPNKGHNMLHIPRIGCGRANGNWDVVSGIISATIKNTKLSVTAWTL